MVCPRPIEFLCRLAKVSPIMALCVRQRQHTCYPIYFCIGQQVCYLSLNRSHVHYTLIKKSANEPTIYSVDVVVYQHTGSVNTDVTGNTHEYLEVNPVFDSSMICKKIFTYNHKDSLLAVCKLIFWSSGPELWCHPYSIRYIDTYIILSRQQQKK